MKKPYRAPHMQTEHLDFSPSVLLNGREWANPEATREGKVLVMGLRRRSILAKLWDAIRRK